MKHLPNHQPNRSRFAMVFLLFMTFLLGSVQGWGQVSTLQAFSNLYNGTSNSQNLNYAVSAGTNSNRLLVVAVTTTLSSAANNRTIALTYGGRSLTLATGDLTTNSQQHTAIYYLTESEIDLASNTTLAFTATNGTTRVNMVWAAVYDYVNQTTPLNNSRNYNSGTNTTSSFSFGTALSLASGNQGVVLICSQRLNNNNSRTITYPTNWSLGNEQTATNTDAMRSGVAARTIPSANTTDNCATTFSGNALASMTGIAINGCSQPTVNAGSALSAICIGGTSAGLGGSVGGSATGGTWTSSVSGGTFLPNATTLNATYTPPSNYTGTVTLSLTTSGGSCGTATASKTLIVNSPPTASAGGVQTICQGNTATVSGASSSNGTIAWTENGSGSITSGATTSTPVYTSSSSDISQVTLTMTVSSAGCANATATYTVYVTANPTAGTLSGTQAICANSTTTFTVSGSSGGTGVFSTNNSSVATVNSTTGVVSGISAGSATITYTVTGSSGCFATATRNVTIAPAPTALTISPASATICNGDIQSLGVIGGVSTSSSVQTIGASGLTTTATSTTATLGPNPFQSYYGGTKQQMLFRASELSALGITNGVVISSISFNMSAVESRTLLNYVVKMKNTSTTAFSNTTFETGLTIVRTASSVTPVVGWNSLNLTSDFTYTGGNLIIEINFSNNDAGAVGTNIAFFDATAFASTLFYRVDSQTAATVDAASTASFSYSQRNSIKFSVSNSEQGNLTWSPTTALYTNSAATTSYTGSPSATVYAKPTETITYTATATSSEGCTSSNTVQVTVNQSSVAPTSITGITSICNGSSTTLTANGTLGTGAAYQWGTGSTVGSDVIAGQTSASINVSPTSTTTYWVRITGTSSPCAATTSGVSQAVTVNPIVTPTFTQVSAICSGASLSALPTTSNNSIAGTWSPEVDNTATTEYTFTPTAGQCALTTTMTITVTPTINYYADADGDGYGNASSVQAACSQPEGYVSNNTDCNDNSSSVNPGASETCNNSDDNCNGQNDEGLATSASTFVTACATYTWSANGTTYTASGNYNYVDGCNTQVLHLTISTPTLTYYVDADGDNFGAGAGSLYCANPGAGYSTSNTDCNDANIAISPMAEELCDGIDNDCNASTADGLGTTVFFRDADGDTFGNPNETTIGCINFIPAGFVTDNTDCDDNNATYHVINTYFEDNDNDTFGNGDAAIEACFATAGYTVNHDDCDDANASVNPSATEICNLIDDDCDGEINDGLTSVDYHFDGDGDGFGSGTATLLCAPTAGYVQNSADCNDNNALVYPGATEICGNTIDEDCAAGDLAPVYYLSAQSGPWASTSTWNISCDNNTYTAANYAPAVGYYGIVTVDAGHTVTVEVNNGQIASTRNLNINAAGSLVVNGKMSVAQTMVNNGTLTVNHGASFLQSSTTAVNSGSGSYVVNMNLTGTSNGSAPNGRYWYVGSPMNNTNVSNTFYNASTMTRLWSYTPATNSWTAIINSSTGFGQGSATTMAVGIGYLYRAGANQSVTFNGTSSTFNNNLTTPLSFTGTGYKFVANPYTSHVDWTAVTRTGLNVSYWIRNENNTNYESYNATSGVSNSPSGQTTKNIPPMQGFYVYAFTAASSLRIDNGDRVHSTNVLHAPMHNQIVRLNLNDGKSDDQAVVYENENASNGIEEFDTDKFIDGNHHQVYFLEGTKQLSLNGLKDATAKQRVDVGIQITAGGTYTINAVELGVEEDVVLEDKFTQTFQDLKRNSSYTFESNTGTYNNRFVLHFTLNPQTETAIETETVGVTEAEGEAEGVSVYTTTGQQVKVWVTNTADFQNATVKVYDAVGNMIERKNMTSNELLLDLNTATGVYLVEVTGTEKVFTKKVFVTK